MGTSMSGQGPKSNTPLLPPWAAPAQPNAPDDQNQTPPNTVIQPLTSVKNKRFKSFRENLGKFVDTGNSSNARKALKHYAKTSTGGGNTAKQRLSAVTTAGASLVSFLSGSGTLHSISYGQDRYISLHNLNGMSVDTAIDELTTALLPENGDADKIRVALNESLSEALQGFDEFNESAINVDLLSNMLVLYLSESIFLQVELDGGNAWEKASSPIARVQAEKDIRELIKSAVQVNMLEKMPEHLNTLSTDTIKSIQEDTITDVWQEWEAYNDNH